MYSLYAIVAVSTLVLSMRRFRQFWHPQVLLTIMLLYMLVLDFLIRGDTDENIAFITPENLWWYQCGVLVVYLAIWGGSYVHGALGVANERKAASDEWVLTDQRQLRLLSVFAAFLVVLEILKRLSFADWSVGGMIDLSLAPRGSAPWNYREGNIGDANFIYQLVIMLFPLSGVIFGYQIVVGSFVARPFAVAGFILVLAVLVVDGARTPVFLVILNLMVCYWNLAKAPIYLKVPVVGLLFTVLGTAAAVMYEFRSAGFDLLFTRAGDTDWTFYHQDDSYYRALNAMDIAATTPERWDAGTFFYTVAVNPIPRFFWPGKPILLEEFWGNYKLEYVTISFIGELVAMFGIGFGLMFSVLAGWLVYLLLRRASALVPTPGGIIIYFLLVLYGYMILRSLYNLTGFAYLPLFGLTLYWLSNHQLRFWRRKASSGASQLPVR